jgi:hypothetical protein
LKKQESELLKQNTNMTRKRIDELRSKAEEFPGKKSSVIVVVDQHFRISRLLKKAFFKTGAF